MKMQMIPAIINDTGDCCCQCPPNGQDGWCHCNDNYDGKGNDIENAITCDLVWAELQPNGQKKYFKVVSGSAQQNMPVVLPTTTLKKRGVVQLTNDLSNREDIALTPKGANQFKATLDKETADRIAKDTDLQNQINKEKTDRASADTDLLNKINQEKADRTGADKTLSDRITQETADRKKADSDLSNRITSAESKADSAVSKANKAVTDVTSDGNATVTVTKADGTSKSFTVNNVAHASSADSATKATTADTATNANHATSADSATKADHATVADRLADGSSEGAGLGFPDYSKGVGLIFRDVLNRPHSPSMTSNGFVVVSCFVEAGSNIEVETVTAKTNIEVNAHSILSLTKLSSMGGGVELRTMLCFPVKKGDTVFVSAHASHSSAGDPISGDVSATFFPCL